MLKSKTGAITLYVTIACFFILMAGIAGYVVINNKQVDQLKQLNENQNIYSNGISKEDIANSYNGGEIIEIETEDQLLKIGSDENIYLKGKVYNFAKNKTYVLKSDWESNSKFDEIEKAVNEAGGVIIKEYDKKGITSEEIANNSSYIGKYVNYKLQGKNIKWKIFYADYGNIYLISSGYLEGESLNINNYTDLSNLTDARIKKWIKYADKYPNTTGITISTVAYLLDTKVWNNKYKNDYAEYVIGAPTMELFNASYKVTHSEKYIEEIVEDENGYKIKWNTDENYSDILTGISTTELENLYVVNDSSKIGYWTASPTGLNDQLPPFYIINDGSIYCNPNIIFTDNVGFRAIVCLKSNVSLVEQGDGTYNLKL